MKKVSSYLDYLNKDSEQQRTKRPIDKQQTRKKFSGVSWENAYFLERFLQANTISEHAASRKLMHQD